MTVEWAADVDIELDAQDLLSQPQPESVQELPGGVPGGEWTVTERRKEIGYKASPRKRPLRRSNSWDGDGRSCSQKWQSIGSSGAQSSGDATGSKPGPISKKSSAIETWVNSSLAEAMKQRKLRMNANGISSTKDQHSPDNAASHFNVDSGALEQLGLDPKASERVQRAMFVYSQGIHSVMEDAVRPLKNRSQALLVLWKAFSAVIETAATNRGSQDSLAALIEQGNLEERAQMEKEFSEQIFSLQEQLQRAVTEKKDLQQEALHYQAEEERQRNEKLMYHKDAEIAAQKHELEIRQRVAAEVRLLDKEHWMKALKEHLDKERARNIDMSERLNEVSKVKAQLEVDLDTFRDQVTTAERQLADFQAQSLESAQTKLRAESKIFTLETSLARAQEQLKELRVQCDTAVEQKNEANDKNTRLQRECRKAEIALEDEAHLKQDLQSKYDGVKQRRDALDDELVKSQDERRTLSAELNEIKTKARSDKIELDRVKELWTAHEKVWKRKEAEFQILQECHRKAQCEGEMLRADVKQLEKTLKEEQELRKSLQLDKVGLQDQLVSKEGELEVARVGMQNSNHELLELTKKSVKLEHAAQQTSQAMQKLQMEHCLEQDTHKKKVAMLELMISKERDQRRQIVYESDEVEKRKEDLEKQLVLKEEEIREQKRYKLEAEEAADRSAVKLASVQNQCDEYRVIAEKGHAAVANHDAEMRQLQALLEVERREAEEQVRALKDAYDAGRHKYEQTIDNWQMRFEDALSLLHFNPTVETIQGLEKKLAIAQGEIKDRNKKLSDAANENDKLTKENAHMAARIAYLDPALTSLRMDHEALLEKYGGLNQSYDQRSVKLCDAEARLGQLIVYISAFDREKTDLEGKIKELRAYGQRLWDLVNVPKTTASVQATECMTDSTGQTDLSYQYLEDAPDLHEGHHRKAKIYNLKQAADFVEDEDARRDFTVRMIAPPTTQLHFEPAQQKKVVLLHAPRELPKVNASPTKTPRSLAPAPPAGCPSQSPLKTPRALQPTAPSGCPARGSQSGRGLRCSMTPSPWTDD